MKEYHKIETLFRFNQETKRYVGQYYNQNVFLLKDNQWIFTEKIDGTNFRINWDGHKLTYGGRTDNAQFSAYQIEFIKTLVNENIETLFEQKFQEKNVTVYGELFGFNIQNGGLYVNGKGLAFRVFDIEIEDIFLTFESAEFLAEELGYQFVPFVFKGTIEEAIKYVQDNDKSIFSNAILEGLVGKPVGDFRDRFGKRIIIKIKKRYINKTDFEKEN